MVLHRTWFVQQLPSPAIGTTIESRPGTIGLIVPDMKQAGERSAANPHAAFDAAGTGNVTTVDGMRSIAKAVEVPPEPNVYAPVLDPTERRTVASIGETRCATSDPTILPRRLPGAHSLSG